MKSSARGPTAAQYNSPERRNRRDIARDVWAAYRAVCQAAGFLPIEIRTAEAITLCHYEIAGQDYDKPRNIKLLLIGAVLSSYGKTDDGKINTASNRTSQFFTDAQPRTGYQLHTRYKAIKENQSHEYVDHIMPVAEVVAAYHADERAAILKDGQGQKQARIHAARERLAAEALELLPKCNAQLVDENGEVYAYLSDAEAKTYAAKNPNFKAQAKTTRPKRPLCSQDFDRIEDKLRRWIEDELEDAKTRNSFDEARLWAARLKTKAPNWIDSWVRTEGRPDGRETGGGEELIHVPKVGGQGVAEPVQADAETGVKVEEGAPQELGGKQGLSGNVCNTDFLNISRGDASADADREPRTGADVGYFGPGAYLADQGADSLPGERLEKLKVDNSAAGSLAGSGDDAGPDLGDLGTGAILQNGVDQDHLGEFGDVAALELVTNPPAELEGSINFDSALNAALAYVADGWAVLPCCQFNPATGRCTEPRHNPTGTPDADVCKGKVPLLAGRKDAKPGDGYTAASRDKGLITEWFKGKFKNAGVAIRLDNIYLGDCALLDVDVKDGKPGLASYDELDATFDLPATLTALTPSGGRHYIFQLPEGLPAGYLGSWGEILPGLDLKVGNKGLEHTEPTVGKTGVYRWVDPTADVAELPRALCEYLHNIHEAKQAAKLEKSRAKAEAAGFPADSSPFNPEDDQGKYFKDAGAGERRPRLRTIACSLAARGANENQIVDVLKYHDGRFSQPTNDIDFMLHVAQGAVSKYGQGVAQ